MSDFLEPKGFEDVWQSNKTRWLAEPRGLAPLSLEAKARLRRIVRRAPEVVVAVRGAARTRRQLQSHLDYLTRDGRLKLETSTDHEVLRGRGDLRDLAEDWSWGAQIEQARRHPNAPISRSLVLSMPGDIDKDVLRKTARQFGKAAFGAFDRVSVLHEDTAHPHVHLTVRTLGRGGEHLNPKRRDLDRWRELFAETLRANGVEAEATRRAVRGVTLKGERHHMLKMRELYEQGRIQRPVTMTEAYKDAAAAVLGERGEPLSWEASLRKRRTEIADFYAAQAAVLDRSSDPEDRALAREVRAFVDNMPEVVTRRLCLARELQDAFAREQARSRSDRIRTRERGPERDR